MTDSLTRTEVVVRTIAQTAVDNEACTSLDIAGASLMLVKLDDEIEELLAASAEVPIRVF